jgi:2-amino-4-hydroxy-6-hydroxymethyldihydropteridine diphosphokinase
MAHIFIGFGTNLGDREKQLQDAWNRLARIISIERTSAVYETEPWGVTGQPHFLNLVVEGETALSPQDLLFAVKTIEHDMGRIRGMRYGPRIIDLDILFYDNLQMKTDELEIPHPRIAERRFVLLPMVNLAPDLVHPRLHHTMRALLDEMPDTGGEQLYSNALE